jgi:hypothetical protein
VHTNETPEFARIGEANRSGTRSLESATQVFRWEKWGLGFEAEKAEWHVFAATRTGWVYATKKVKVSKGLQNLLLRELLKGHGAITKNDAIKILSAQGTKPKELKTVMSRLRGRIRAAVGANKADNPFHAPDRNTPSFVLRLQIGQAVRDNDLHVSDNPALRFDPCQ